MKLTEKQTLAFDYLTDSSTSIIGYGGAAGGGKSVVGCYAMLVLCSELNGSKWFIGRDRLKDTRESVLFTFRKVSKELGIRNWKYNDNHIYFKNGSEIEFLDLSFYPQADPLYERLGSKEYTGGWIEEAGAVHPMAFEVLKTRINRWYNKAYGLSGKILVTFNPKKGWLDSTFYQPYKKKQEHPKVKFIPALYYDNPHLDEDYVALLKAIKDKSTRARLLDGNFDYDDDPTSLIDYEAILNIWHNEHVKQKPVMYLTADIARFGSDWARILVWNDFRIVDYVSFHISRTTDIQNAIFALRMKHGIQVTKSIADEDGVGGGVVDNCKILGFVNNSKAVDPAYMNLKCECGYKLAEMIHRVHFAAEVSDSDKQQIESELAVLKTYDADKDNRLRILPKEKQKEILGHSPDWLDNFIMRMYFEIGSPASMNEAYEKALKYFS